jgi:hypothetical protein
MVQGQELLPSVSETVENDITSRGALDGKLKQGGYDRFGMLHMHVALTVFIDLVTGSEWS